MRIFLSWSGTKSHNVAEALRSWIPAVIQAARPYFSPDDIQKGARWSSEIAKELEDSKVGILCVTKQNLAAPWLLFEAGALAKSMDRSRVIPLLLDVEPADLTGPLAQFQATRFEKTEVRKLVGVINAQLNAAALDDAVLQSVFEKWWPDLETRVNLALQQQEATPSKPTRQDREVLDEILGLVRDLSFRSAPRMGLIAQAMAESGTRSAAETDSLQRLNLTARTLQCLHAEGFVTVGEVIQKTEAELLKRPSIGRKSLMELKEALAANGFELSDEL